MAGEEVKAAQTVDAAEASEAVAEAAVARQAAAVATRRLIHSTADAGRKCYHAALRIIGIVGFASLGFLGLFILHQSLLWATVRPAVAFEQGKVIVYVAEVAWNSYARLGNANNEVLDTVVPLWNSFAKYAVEPAIYVGLDVLSLVFTGDEYRGLITEDQVPYAGYVCDVNDRDSLAWCGAFAFYKQALEEDESFSSSSIVLGPATARRLQEATGEAIVPVIDVSSMIPALGGLVSSGITLLGSLADLVFHVIYTVLSESATLVFDAFLVVVKALTNVVLAIVRSGMLETIITFFIDILMIAILEIALPLLFAAIDALMCLFDLFFPDGWDEQLKCAHGPNRSFELN